MGAQVLEKVDIFCDLNQEQIAQIFAICKEVVYFQGELIFAEGSPSTEFYVILEGEVAIQVDPDLISHSKTHHQPGTIATLHPGQSFGEVALVDQGLRSASAVCNTMVCKTLVLMRDDLMNLLKNDSEMGFIIMSNLARELCFKIRLSNLNLREAMLYLPHAGE
jgi:CRP-like cAMP-binding protein